MLPLTMNGGPYIYDSETKKFVTRPSAAQQQEPQPASADMQAEPMPPSSRVKPPQTRGRQKRIVWAVSVVLFLAWLILLKLWPWHTSSSVISRSMSQDSPEETFSK